MPLSDLTQPDVRHRLAWKANEMRSGDGTAVFEPSFVAESGSRVWVVDVRDDEELTGPLGHVPRTWRIPQRRITEVATILHPETSVVLVCSDGVRSLAAARLLASLGMSNVGAMRGGMRRFRSEGYTVSRAPSVLGRMLTAPAPGMGSNGRPLHAMRKEAGGLSADEIRAHVGPPEQVRRKKLASFLLASRCACVDGRDEVARIGTPGGDAGELVLALAAVEEIGGALDLGKMTAITRTLADAFGGMYHHTDYKAFNALTRALGEDPRFGGAVMNLRTAEDWIAFVGRPPEHLEQPLLEHLTDARHVGCGHLKLAIQRPEDYGVRPELVKSFMRTFYELLWDGDPDMEWVVLGGDHGEGALANVTMAEPFGPYSGVPLIAPQVGDVQMFVNHPQAIAFLRDQMVQVLEPRADLLPLSGGSGSKLTDAIRELGGQQAGMTLKLLAAGLPIFGLHFAPDGTLTVTEEGTIPGPEA